MTVDEFKTRIETEFDWTSVTVVAGTETASAEYDVTGHTVVGVDRDGAVGLMFSYDIGRRNPDYFEPHEALQVAEALKSAACRALEQRSKEE